ncbi:MAG: carbohydrate kinase family protein [Lentimicrobiaceae bacterium]|jgi:sugar/nucleoside kinase (ribokinase family)
MKKLDVVVIGELNVDLILTGLPSIPEMGQCKLSKDMHFTLGSASAIFASNIARLGLNVGFVGKIGGDFLGDFILQSLNNRNVDTSQIIKDNNAKTGISVSLSSPDNYAMASYAGVRESFRLSDIDFDYVSKAKHLHMSSYYLQTGMQEGCSELFRRAKEMGLTTSLDPDSDPYDRWDTSIFEILKHVDIFLPNEKEAFNISKCNNIESALDLLNLAVNTIVIKTGKHGAWAKNHQKTIHLDGFKIDVVDTTGAGDSFNSGFIYKYLKGSDIADCTLWGNACAAISTTQLGGTTVFPNISELQQFLAERKEEIEHIIAKRK